MKFDYKNIEHWLHGLGAAFIGGSASMVSVVVVSPDTFNLGSGWRNLVEVCIVNGIITAAAYLKTSPLPSSEDSK